MAENIFSTGKMYLAAYGSNLTTGIAAGNLLGEVQDATFDGQFTEKMSYTDAATTRYPIAVGYHEGKVSLQLTFRDFNPLLWTRLMNITVDTVTNTGYNTYAFGAGTKPAQLAAFFQMQDTQDNDAGVLWIPNAYAGGVNTSLKLADFADSKITITGILDPTLNAAYLLCQPTGTPV